MTPENRRGPDLLDRYVFMGTEQKANAARARPSLFMRCFIADSPGLVELETSYVVCHQRCSVSDVEPASANDGVRPVRAGALGHFERADDFKLLRRWPDEADGAFPLFVAVEQSVGLGD